MTRLQNFDLYPSPTSIKAMLAVLPESKYNSINKLFFNDHNNDGLSYQMSFATYPQAFLKLVGNIQLHIPPVQYNCNIAYLNMEIAHPA